MIRYLEIRGHGTRVVNNLRKCCETIHDALTIMADNTENIGAIGKEI